MGFEIIVRRSAVVTDHEERPAVELVLEDGLVVVRRIPANGNVRAVAIGDLKQAVDELWERDGKG